MKIITKLIKNIKPNPDNPRTIKDDQYKKLVKSLKEFPEMTAVRPIVINTDQMILGGNMRYRAALEAGWTEIPVIEVDWSEDKQREFIVKDNVSGGEWDWDLLANEWEQEKLEDWGLDTKQNWESPEVEEDEAPEVDESEPPKSKLGEVYQLGRHRVMCGDSTKIEDVEKLMDGAKADMVFTDPPYNVGYDYSEYDDNKSRKEYVQFLRDAIPLVSKTIIHNGNKKIVDMAEAFGEPYHVGCWTKTNAMSPSSISSFSVWEPVFFYGKFKRKDGSDLFNYPISNQKDTGGHTCPKPLRMCVDMINDFNEGEMVYDPFLGSGSTLIACEQTNRTCYGMELDPKYVDVVRKRWAKYVYPDRWEEEWQAITPAIKNGE